MKTSLAELSNIYQDLYQKESQAPLALCPPLEHLVQSVMGKMPRKKRQEVTGHAASCATCAAALKKILALSAETDRAASEFKAREGRRTSERSETGRTFWIRPVLKPAVVILAGIFVVAALIVSIPRLLERSGTRGPTEARIVLVSPLKAEATRDSLDFKWQGLAGADHYTVEVFDRTFRLVWRSGRVTGTETRLQAEAAQRIIPGEAYYWMVTAVTNGRPAVQSKLAEFSVTR